MLLQTIIGAEKCRDGDRGVVKHVSVDQNNHDTMTCKMIKFVLGST